MTDCNFCERRDVCAYEYKPCDCFDFRKFKPAPHVVCASCKGNGYDPYPLNCRTCNGCGAVPATTEARTDG